MDIHQLARDAGVPPELAVHYEPLLKLLLAARPKPTSTATPVLDLEDLAFDPWRSYSGKQAAPILGLAKAESVHEIDPVELPRQRVGPTRTSVRYLGIDLLCYLKGLPPVDYQSLRDAAAGELADEDGPLRPSTVRAIGRRGKRRVV